MRKAISLGARLPQPADDLGAGEDFQVYADPAGHPFCLCWASPTADLHWYAMPPSL